MHFLGAGSLPGRCAKTSGNFKVAQISCCRGKMYELASPLSGGLIKIIKHYFSTSFLRCFVLNKELKIPPGVHLYYSPERHARACELGN